MEAGKGCEPSTVIDEPRPNDIFEVSLKPLDDMEVPEKVPLQEETQIQKEKETNEFEQNEKVEESK